MWSRDFDQFVVIFFQLWFANGMKNHFKFLYSSLKEICLKLNPTNQAKYKLMSKSCYFHISYPAQNIAISQN